MNPISVDLSMTEEYISPHELEYAKAKVNEVHRMLHERYGQGNEYTGWLDLPSDYDRKEFDDIKKTATEIRKNGDALIVIGIGGSYLGARSALDLLNHSFYNNLPASSRSGPQIFFAGNNISSTYLAQLLDIVKDKDIYVNVVSKSGTTLEPALAFRFFRRHLEDKYGEKEAAKRIIATTDKEKGVLKELADRKGYRTFIVPDDVGGRFSVLTAVGLLPIAVGGVNIEEVMAGAQEGRKLFSNYDLDTNPAYLYAAVRNIMYLKQKTVEALVGYEPSLNFFIEWWKQLFGESEGKDKRGIMPIGLNFTTDLHSLGQYVQDGLRNLYLTTLWIKEPLTEITVPELEADDDNLNYLAGKGLHYINEKAFMGTLEAHTGGGVPNIIIRAPKINAYNYGMLIYFFQKACAVSGYLLGVNPFDQPGVEAYKKNMFALLGK